MDAEGIACGVCGAANRAGARFCDVCGSRLEVVRQDTRRTVTILFVDVAGSTALGERLDPEALRALIGAYFDLAKTVIDRHGGSVEKFIGDAVMAVFGLPTLHEDDALRAVRAAHDLRAELQASGLGDRIVTRTGVNTGQVVAGDAADAQRLVTGDAVNVAARLEQHAPHGEILLGEATYRLVRGAVEAEEVPPIAAKGKSEPLRAWRLVSIDPTGEATPRHLDAPLVGRERELTRLLRSYEDAVAERRCGLFTLLGPAGVGKSRLVFELVRRVGDEATVLKGRCLPYGEGITYWPIAEIVRGAASIEETDDREAALAKLRALVASEPDGPEIADRIATAIGLQPGVAPRDDVFRAARRLVETLAARRALVLVFDDLQWAEPTLVDLVEHLVDWSRGVPVLVVVLARPELLDARPTWGGGKLDAQTVLLEGLGADDTRALATALLGADVDPKLIARIEAVAEGNPLFLEHVIAMLVEDGQLVRDGGAWRATADLASIHVPPTISALMAARLDRLPAPERHLAERASVVGRVFERLQVAELLPEADRQDVPERLRSLVRRELIRPDPSGLEPDDSYRFRHILIRDAAYEALSKRDRADLHARFADWLERTTGGRLAEFEEIVGYHLDQAVRYRDELGLDDAVTTELRGRAAVHLSRAGHRALARGDPSAAMRLLAHALALRVGPEDANLNDLFAISLAHKWASENPQALAYLEEAERIAAAGGDVVTAITAEVMAATTRLFALGIGGDELDAVADRALTTLADHPDDTALANAWLAKAEVAHIRASWAKAVEAYERALEHALRVDESPLREIIAAELANAYIYGPLPVDEGLARLRALRLQVRGRTLAARITTLEGTLLGIAGRTEEAWATYERGQAELAELGLAGVVGVTGLGPSQIASSAGDLEGSIRELAAGRVRLLAKGETSMRSTVEAWLAIWLAWLGRDDEAIEVSVASESISVPDDFATEAGWRQARALAFAHQGRLDDARRLIAEALAVWQRTDQPVAHAQGLEIAGEIERLAGVPDAARTAWADALTLYELKGCALAASVQRRIDALPA